MHMSRKFVFQGVHMLFDGQFMDEWAPDEKRETRFVFIGKNLDKEELIQGFLACKVEDPELRFEVGEFLTHLLRTISVSCDTCPMHFCCVVVFRTCASRSRRLAQFRADGKQCCVFMRSRKAWHTLETAAIYR